MPSVWCNIEGIKKITLKHQINCSAHVRGRWNKGYDFVTNGTVFVIRKTLLVALFTRIASRTSWAAPTVTSDAGASRNTSSISKVVKSEIVLRGDILGRQGLSLCSVAAPRDALECK